MSASSGHPDSVSTRPRHPPRPARPTRPPPTPAPRLARSPRSPPIPTPRRSPRQPAPRQPVLRQLARASPPAPAPPAPPARALSRARLARASPPGSPPIPAPPAPAPARPTPAPSAARPGRDRLDFLEIGVLGSRRRPGFLETELITSRAVAPCPPPVRPRLGVRPPCAPSRRLPSAVPPSAVAVCRLGGPPSAVRCSAVRGPPCARVRCPPAVPPLRRPPSAVRRPAGPPSAVRRPVLPCAVRPASCPPAVRSRLRVRLAAPCPPGGPGDAAARLIDSVSLESGCLGVDDGPVSWNRS